MQTAAAHSTSRPAAIASAAGQRRKQGVARAQSGPDSLQPASSRRGVLLGGAVLLASAVQQQRLSRADELVAQEAAPAAAVQQAPAAQQQQLAMKTLEDGTLAYRFEYPTAASSGKPLPLVFSRKPERYSSAAPLTADARQRIVCELADLMDAVTVSVTVGPPAGILKGREQSEWTPRQVAEQVLVDRSTARITTGQRISLNSVEEAAAEQRDGTTYYVFEHVSQGSPTMRTLARETYRHSLAVTAVRSGVDGTPYLYTLNMSCPQELWEDAQAAFAQGVASFRLLPPGPKYVAPDQQSWRFF